MKYENEKFFWTIKIKDLTLNVFLLGISDNTKFLSNVGNKNIYIYLEPDKIPVNLSHSEKHRFIYFLDDLLSNPNSFLKLVGSL